MLEITERSLADCATPAIGAATEGRRSFMGDLRGDLLFFEPRLVPDVSRAAREALDVASSIRRRARVEPLTILGYLYVLDGSARGAPIVASWAREAYLLTPTQGLGYLAALSADGGRQVATFLTRLDALALNRDEHDVVISAARELCQALARVFQGLDPLEDTRFLATGINSEAGSHAVPTDPAELSAALDASDACWRAFPYFERRYGERGRRFARSDGAWLATLTSYPSDRIEAQLEWLGRVLASRGMPRLLLQRHLEELVAFATAACPSCAADYQRLAAAAHVIAQRRRAAISDEEAERLIAEFDARAPSEDAARHPDAARLVIASVQDEHDGLPGSVDSVCAHFADPRHGSREWIDAVRQLVAAARRIAADRTGCPVEVV